MQTSIFSNSNASSEDQEFILADICEDYFLRRERGESPCVDEYIARYPDLSQEIRGAVQALMLMQASGDPSDAEIQAVLQMPEISGFVLHSEIGRGAAGVVYEAIQVKENRRVALKLLNARGRMNPNLQDRFLREAAVALRLNHPHIVRGIGSGRTGDNAYMSMEFIDGYSFHKLIEVLLRSEQNDSERHPDSQNETLQKLVAGLKDYRQLASFGADVASALAYAHEQRVIHRDIKPANLIVDTNGKAWVADFGLAKVFSDDNQMSLTGDMIGTPRYMAPEQIRGVCSTHSDIYSLGVTLYEFAARKKAWESVGKTQLPTVRASMDLPNITTVNANVPPGLAKIITKACAFDPADRYESAQELEAVLRRFAAGKQNADRRTRERLEEDTFVRRRSIVLTIGLIAGVTVAALLMATREEVEQLDTPALVMSVLSNEEILTQAIESLPDSPEEDTLKKKFERKATAIQTQGLINKTTDEYVEDESDRQWVKETSEEFVDAYSSGDMSRKDAEAVITGAATLISMARIHSAAQKIRESDWSESEKKFGIGVCHEVCSAMLSGAMTKDTSSQLKRLIPGKTVVGVQLSVALRNFVSQSWSTLNAIPGIPNGSPHSLKRRSFFEAIRLQQSKAATK